MKRIDQLVEIIWGLPQKDHRNRTFGIIERETETHYLVISEYNLRGNKSNSVPKKLVKEINHYSK